MNIIHIKDFELVDKIPKSILEHPGMISRQERELLYSLAYKYYRGYGCIIDAGAFLGASTVAFYQGLKDRGFLSDKYKPILSFELALVRENFDRHAKKWGLPSPDIGESYESILRQQINHTFDLVDLRLGDILEYDAKDLTEVEIAFLDILKNERIAKFCFDTFLPCMVEGGIIIQQDYFFDDLPFIKYMTEALDEYLDYKGEVRSSAIFTLNKLLDRKVLEERVYNLSDEEKLRLHAIAEKRTISRNRQYVMQMSRARLLTEMGRLSEAREIWLKAEEDYAKEVFEDDGAVKNTFQWRHERLKNLMERKERN